MIDDLSAEDAAVAETVTAITALLAPLAQNFGARAVRRASEQAHIAIRREFFPLQESVRP